MYDKILRQMRKAIKDRRVRFVDHAFDEMGNEGFSKSDAFNAILTGEIIDDQFDIDYQDTKYIIYGDALDGRELGLVTKFDRYGNIVIITVFGLKISDYE